MSKSPPPPPPPPPMKPPVKASHQSYTMISGFGLGGGQEEKWWDCGVSHQSKLTGHWTNFTRKCKSLGCRKNGEEGTLRHAHLFGPKRCSCYKLLYSSTRLKTLFWKYSVIQSLKPIQFMVQSQDMLTHKN